MAHTEILELALGIAGGLVFVLLTIIGFFVARVVTDVRKNTSEIGKNKGKIELVEQQQINDTKRIEEMTQLELKSLSQNVSVLSDNVNTLVTALAKKALDQGE